MTTHKQDVKTHTPEGWTILRFQNPQKEPFYKVFATWRQNDMWKISSGAFDALEAALDGEFIVWPQASGSIYKLPLGEENGYTFFQSLVMNDIVEKGLAHGVQITEIALSDVPGLPNEVRVKL
ncbi:hypothetical protein NTE10_000607 [Vibrio harveyi]|nr:hypothetical protein [Vibrio harveyi]